MMDRAPNHEEALKDKAPGASYFTVRTGLKKIFRRDDFTFKSKAPS
jgi:hypothetical protein